MTTRHARRRVRWFIVALLVTVSCSSSDGGNSNDDAGSTPSPRPAAAVATATSSEQPVRSIDVTRTPAAPPTIIATPPSQPNPREPTATKTTVEPTVVPATETPIPPVATETPVPPTETPAPPALPGDEGQVVEVIDGDTLDVVVGGVEYRVRIIGVDTPETRDPNSPVMCYGAEATAFTQDMVNRANGKVYLEKDISETDRYDRLLRYVWLAHPDGNRMLNYELVAGGYAQVSTYPPDVKYTDSFLEAQATARNEGRGLWGYCGSFGVPVEQPTPTPAPVAPQPTAPPSGGNCDPSYPGVCIQPYSQVGDLDCGDVQFRRFQVIPPDPHGFDADGDGVGCESG